MKKLLIVIVVIAALIAGYFLLMKNPVNISGAPAYGRLDMKVVCEGALSYMSFPDGASADVFVDDCVEGKYPDVIERYKADLNIGDDIAI